MMGEEGVGLVRDAMMEERRGEGSRERRVMIAWGLALGSPGVGEGVRMVWVWACMSKRSLAMPQKVWVARKDTLASPSRMCPMTVSIISCWSKSEAWHAVPKESREKKPRTRAARELGWGGEAPPIEEGSGVGVAGRSGEGLGEDGFRSGEGSGGRGWRGDWDIGGWGTDVV